MSPLGDSSLCHLPVTKKGNRLMKHYLATLLFCVMGVLTGCNCVHPARQPGKNTLHNTQESMTQANTLIYQQPAERLHWSSVIIEPVRWHVTCNRSPVPH